MLRAVVPAVVWSCLVAAAAAQQLQFQVPSQRSVPPVLVGHIFPDGPVASGDVDGDGDIDVVMWDFTLLRWFRRTPGGLQPPTPGVAYSSRAERIELVDLDFDGYLDVLLVPELTLFRYDPQLGDFVALALPAQLDHANAQVALADLDGDGWRDLVVAPPLGSVNSLEVWRGGPGFQFTLAQGFPLTPPQVLRPVLGDLDGDGDLDVVAAQGGPGLAVFVNQNGVLVDRTSLLPSGLPTIRHQLVADFDGDGADDYLAVATTGASAVLWGSPSGWNTIQPLPDFDAALTSVWAADFDGDGRHEVMACHAPSSRDLDLGAFGNGRQFTRERKAADASSAVGVADIDGDGGSDFLFLVNGRLQCWRRGRIAAVAAPDFASLVGRPPTAQLGVGDLDGDHRSDLVATTPTWTAWHSDGAGGFTGTTATIAIPSGALPARVVLADLDRDGDLDYVACADSGLYVARNDGAAGFIFASPVGTPLSRRDGMRVVDVDADGLPDVLLAVAAGIELRRGLGAAQFGAPQLVHAMQVPPECFEVVDVDGDGDPDLVTDDIAASGLTHVVLANDGTGTFASDPSYYANLGSVPTSIRAVDLDGDGDQDLVVLDGLPRILRNNGHGVFVDTTPFHLPPLTDTIVSNLEVADLDGDGHLDIVAQALQRTLLLLGSANGTLRDASLARVAARNATATKALLRAVDVDGDGDLDLVHSDVAGEQVVVNQLRQCRSTAVPILGSAASAELLTGPGFGSSGVALFGVGLPLPTPLRVPGIAGQLEADPSALQMLVSSPTSLVGVSTVFFTVPALPQLFGLDVIYQGVVLPISAPAGFTNAIHERILQP